MTASESAPLEDQLELIVDEPLSAVLGRIPAHCRLLRERLDRLEAAAKPLIAPADTPIRHDPNARRAGAEAAKALRTATVDLARAAEALDWDATAAAEAMTACLEAWAHEDATGEQPPPKLLAWDTAEEP